jgi:hypothetical protein
VDNGQLVGGPDGKENHAIATGKQMDPDSPAKLGVSFFLPSQDFSYQDYWIVDLVGSAADSYQVAVVYSCETKLGFIDNSNMWILSRTPELPNGLTIEDMYDRARALNIDVEGLKMIENDITGCFGATEMGSPDSVFDGEYVRPPPARPLQPPLTPRPQVLRSQPPRLRPLRERL